MAEWRDCKECGEPVNVSSSRAFKEGKPETIKCSNGHIAFEWGPYEVEYNRV
jgi:hypothetical protein